MRAICLILLLTPLPGCAYRGCEEWGTRQVVDYNFCTIGDSNDQDFLKQGATAANCVGQGVRDELYCASNPSKDAKNQSTEG